MYIGTLDILKQDFIDLYNLTSDGVIYSAFEKECDEITNFYSNIRDIVDTWNDVFNNKSTLNDYYILLYSLFEGIRYKKYWNYHQIRDLVQQEDTIITILASHRSKFTDKLKDICRLSNLNRDEYTLIEYKRCNFKTYSELLQKYGTKKLIIYLSRGSYFIVDTNTLVLNSDFILSNQNINIQNLVISIIINNLIEKQKISKEELINHKTRIVNINISELTASTSDVTNLLRLLLEGVYNLNQKQNDLIEKYQILKNRRIQILIEQTIKNQIKSERDKLSNEIGNLEVRYKELLDKRFNLQCKELGVNELINNCYTKLTRYLDSQIDNTLVKYDFSIEDRSILVIKLTTRWLPIVFMDKQMAQVTINNNVFEPIVAGKLQSYIDGRCTFYVTPITLQIKINLLNNTLSSFMARNNNSLPEVTNGHIYYSCLGTFKLEIEKAIFEMNLAKTTALFIQYLQSITPTDVAGQRAIRNCCIVDNDLNIIYSAYDAGRDTNRLIGHNINDYDYQKGDWKDDNN